MHIEIKQISPADEQVKGLFKLLDAHNMSHCPPEVCHLTQPEELQAADSILLGLFCDDELCGMGGLKFLSDYAEVTRMFVRDKYRGRQLAVKLLDELITKARERNKTVLKLETSDKFKQAMRLYEKYGFRLCEPFGEYVDKPYNTYMELNIGVHN